MLYTWCTSLELYVWLRIFHPKSGPLRSAPCIASACMGWGVVEPFVRKNAVIPSYHSNEWIQHVLKNTQIYLNVCIMIMIFYSICLYFDHNIPTILSGSSLAHFNRFTLQRTTCHLIWWQLQSLKIVCGVFINTKSAHSVSCHNPRERVLRMHHSWCPQLEKRFHSCTH